MKTLLLAVLLCFPVLAQAQIRVAMLGDSITDGVGISSVSRTYPSRLQDLLGPAYDVDEFATSGDTVANATTAWTNNVDNQGYNWLVVLIGINNLAGSADGTTTFNSVDVIVSDALGQGMQVVWMTVLPCKLYSGCSAPEILEIAEFNALVMARSSVEAVNANATFSDPCDATILEEGKNHGDGLHVNNAGAQALAQLAYTAIVTP